MTILGHVQRGGTPTAFDRVLATRFGVAAVDATAAGEFGQMVALHGTEIARVPLDDALREPKLLDPVAVRDGGGVLRMSRIDGAHTRTKIVATIGPASDDVETLARMAEAGMDVARLNFSHGTPEEKAATAERVHEAANRAGRQVAVLQDLPGPKLRIGALKDGVAELKPGDQLTLVCGSNEEGDARRMSVAWAGLGRGGGAGRGDLPGRRLGAAAGDGRERRMRGGHRRRAGRRRHLPPGPQRARLAGGAAARCPRRTSSCCASARRWAWTWWRCRSCAAPRTSRRCASTPSFPLIAKIEKPQAVVAAESIIHAADCVMVARGDLGIELNIEEVPLVQKRIIALAGELARPVITATQMLESMVTSTRPTRAEVTDVANAILDGTDAVMLSQETAIGAHPVETVEMMEAIARRTEQDVPYERWNEARVRRLSRKDQDPAYTVAYNATAGGAPAGAQRARDPDALGPLGAAGGGAPPPGAGLRALAARGDRPPLRPDLGRRGGARSSATR